MGGRPRAASHPSLVVAGRMDASAAIIDPAGFTCPVPVGQYDRIVLGHGSGGGLTVDLIRQFFLPAFDNPVLAALEDQATVTLEGKDEGRSLKDETNGNSTAGSSFVLHPYPASPSPPTRSSSARSSSPAGTSGNWPSTGR